MIHISHGVLESQAKRCWMFVHVGYTAIYFFAPRWFKRCLFVGIAAPAHNPKTGYSRTRFYIHWGKP